MTDRQEALLFGGVGPSGPSNDTWVWKAGCWTQLTPAHIPPKVTSDPAIAYDAVHKVLVMYGDYWSSAGPTDGTWIWDGTDWQPQTAVGPQFVGAEAYDPSSQRVLLFAEGTNQTWSWDGAQWQKLSPVNEPGARQGGVSMSFDPATGKVVLFGGIGLNHEYLADTWSWDGSTWSRLSPAASPPGRAYAVLVPYSAMHQLLLIGGENGAVLSDAWKWNGSTWTAMPSFGPRDGANAVEIGTKVMLFGGGSGTQTTNDVWWWDGASWSAS